MSTAIEKSDLEAICQALAAGQAIDPEVSRRVEERAAIAREDMRRRELLNVAVDLIREGRDEA